MIFLTSFFLASCILTLSDANHIRGRQLGAHETHHDSSSTISQLNNNEQDYAEFMSTLVSNVTIHNDDRAPHETRDLGGTRIVGGTVAPLNAYPWFAKALTSSNSWGGCGGTLVTPEYVLTAAHCISNSLAKYHIGAYCNQAGNCGQASQIVNIATKYVHERYNDATMEYDFALIKLASRVTVTSPVKMDQGTVSPNYPAGEFQMSRYDSISIS